MSLNRLVFVSISALLLALWTGSATAAPGLAQVLWTCRVPCETTEAKPQTLSSIQFGWCAKTVLTDNFFDALSSKCKSESQNPKAHAVRRGYHGGSTARCDTSGNPCPEEGLSNVNFSCHAVCPGEEGVLRYSVCATTGREAWRASSLVCAGAEMPTGIATGKNCDPNGQTPCTP